ncbi:MAG: LacI family transcriptional regulator [Polaromonas sp.]|nr:LacI family transcriptional regulator [Polaromonas sp.]
MTLPNLFLRALGVTALTLAACSALAQTYPTRTVTVVVPFSPGGGSDTGARMLAQKLSEKWGQSVIVENKAGAAGMVGADHVSKAKPDGYTLLVGNIGTQAINGSLYKKMAYDPVNGFAPISLIAELPLVMLVHPSVPAKNPQELIAHVKANPGKVSYSSSGAGSSLHLAAELFQAQSGTQLLHVPYKGSGAAMADLLAGHVNMSVTTVLESSAQVKSGKVRAIALTGASRSNALPDVPTLAESGLPGFNSISWIGLLAPAGTPDALVEKISADVREVMASDELKRRFVEQGAVPAPNTPAQFRALIDSDRKRYAQIIHDKGITSE